MNSHRLSQSRNAGWLAILKKEAIVELRSRSGLLTAVLFAVNAVVTISLATFDLQISPQLGAGLLGVGILFSAVATLPRTVLIEEEQGTSDLLRLLARSEDVYWGKCAYNLSFMLVTTALLTALFVGFTKSGIGNWWLLMICILGSSMAFAGTVTLCGALVSHATHRTALVGVVAVPLLLPLSFMAVSAMRVALDVEGRFDTTKGMISGIGLLSYGAASIAVGVYLFKAVWRR